MRRPVQGAACGSPTVGCLELDIAYQLSKTYWYGDCISTEIQQNWHRRLVPLGNLLIFAKFDYGKNSALISNH